MPRIIQPAIYILGNNNLTLYIGVTSNLIQRIFQHKQSLVKGFTQKYKLHKLLYYESFDTMEQAIVREKQIKNWKREWKLELIRKTNPDMRDLYVELVDAESGSV